MTRRGSTHQVNVGHIDDVAVVRRGDRPQSERHRILVQGKIVQLFTVKVDALKAVLGAIPPPWLMRRC